MLDVVATMPSSPFVATALAIRFVSFSLARVDEMLCADGGESCGSRAELTVIAQPQTACHISGRLCRDGLETVVDRARDSHHIPGRRRSPPFPALAGCRSG